MILGVIASALLPLTPALAVGGWEAAAFSGEGKRTVQGCALKYTDEAYVCLFVRCDSPGQIGLHITAAGGFDPRGQITFQVDGEPFTVNFLETPRSSLPLSMRAEAFPDELLAAMKRGKQVKITSPFVTPGYDTIPLKNAGPSISRLEKSCASGIR